MNRRVAIQILALTVLAVAARLLLLGEKSLWADEAYAATLANLPLADACRLFSSGTPHPAGGIVLVWVSSRVFGHSAWGIRMLVALLTASAVIPLFDFTRRRFPAGAVWASLVWAISPWSVSLGQEAWVYGPLAASSIWAVCLADRAWRGSRPALAGFLAVSVAGFLVQHIFVLSAAAALGLYFTVPRSGRTGIRPLAASAALLCMVFLAGLIPFAGQFRARAARMAAAGAYALDFRRMIVRSPLVFARLWAGGLLPDSWRSLLAHPFPALAATVSAALQSAAVGCAAACRGSSRPHGAWIAAILLVPFVLFLRDDPTPRQFPLAWLATAVGVAALSARWRWAGPAVVLLCASMALPYYRLDTFPYHRSDWRGAVELVEERAGEGSIVVLAGAKTAGQAWDFYARRDLARLVPECPDPYLGDLGSAGRMDPAVLLDSLADAGREVWLVQDYWGGPGAFEMAGSRPVLFDSTLGTVTVILVGGS